MLLCKKLSLERAGRSLIENVELQIHAGWRVGLVGANGSGKSSFLALIAGELPAAKGDIVLPPGWTIARVSQEVPALATPALEFVLDGDVRLRELERQIAAAESQGLDGESIGKLHAHYDEQGGYSARARAAEILHGLGFIGEDFSRPVEEFSGGWRVRLNLARALFCPADLLLLDEPTNHLDLDAVLWLENWLKNISCTLLLISHDRDFLDAVSGHILAIENKRLTLYSGGYSAFESVRAARLAAQQAAHAAQQRRIAHLQAFVDRFRAKASKARQAQSRLKTLARMEITAAAQAESSFDFSCMPPDALPDPLLSFAQASVGYRGQALLRDVELVLRPACRIGLLGRNGAGKSTLIKLLAGELPLLAGERTAARNLVIGYFAQHQLEQLRPDESPLQHLSRQNPATAEQELRDYLGGFGFRGDMATFPVATFSGGEKTRLALALLIRRRPNLLLLDEPTNHLDLEMREALCFALQDYAGGVVLVSHDRHLLRAVSDELWQVSDGRLAPFDGDLDDYAAWLGRQRAGTSLSAKPGQLAEKEARRKKREAESSARQSLLQQRRPLVKELAQLDAQLAALGTELASLATALAD
ncbi:MAG: ATP-binding cassette domain-containing protein, partial [Zoogloeaceae bacterium]|nr:ATP-binding cassette domain-containing protein [Zoogloeaceae bacterium]